MPAKSTAPSFISPGCHNISPKTGHDQSVMGYGSTSASRGAIKAVAFFTLIFGLHFSSFAQWDRAPDAAEKKAIDKAVNAVASVIEQFGHQNWEKAGGEPIAPEYYSIENKPVVPIGTAPFYRLAFFRHAGFTSLGRRYKAAFRHA